MELSLPGTLADLLLASTHSDDSILRSLGDIYRDVLTHSIHLRQANFKSIHIRDLEFLFAAYDAAFLHGRCRLALAGRKLKFRLSSRMTRAAGKTTAYRARDGEMSFEIAIAASMLFDGFGDKDRPTTVCGRECRTRLEGLQRIFEHELVHLTEQLSWGHTDCRGVRFQGIASRMFLHRAHTHDLITRQERAAESGIRLGSRVTFPFEGQILTGQVNRITKRATVLVERPDGVMYSDGLRYKTYYVPIRLLQAVVVDPQRLSEERRHIEEVPELRPHQEKGPSRRAEGVGAINPLPTALQRTNEFTFAVSEPFPRDLGRLEGMLTGPSGPACTSGKRIGRNELCPCGSGRKYKKCCGG